MPLRLDRGEVEITAIAERAQDGQQARDARRLAGHRAHLDHCEAFPVAALCLVILLERIDRQRERAGIAVRPQAHVDAEHEAVARHRVECVDK
jgi:hypothetical protein